MHDDHVAQFIRTYAPRSICPQCLAALMQEDQTFITDHTSRHVVDGHVVAHRGECLNCRETRTVYRSRGG